MFTRSVAKPAAICSPRAEAVASKPTKEAALTVIAAIAAAAKRKIFFILLVF